MSGNLFIVSAPSGAGKTTLVAALIGADPQVKKSVSYTTRAPRASELNGREYHFIDNAAFERMLARGDFLEHALVHGNRYGTSREWVSTQLALDQDILLEIDWQGAAQVRRLQPEAIGVFVLPPSLMVLEQRLRGRAQDTADVIAGRLANARAEIAHVVEFNYVIINDTFDRAAQDLVTIVRAERLRLARQIARHGDLINGMK